MDISIVVGQNNLLKTMIDIVLGAISVAAFFVAIIATIKTKQSLDLSRKQFNYATSPGFLNIIDLEFNKCDWTVGLCRFVLVVDIKFKNTGSQNLILVNCRKSDSCQLGDLDYGPITFRIFDKKDVHDYIDGMSIGGHSAPLWIRARVELIYKHDGDLLGLEKEKKEKATLEMKEFIKSMKPIELLFDFELSDPSKSKTTPIIKISGSDILKSIKE